jgi:hypothetical protein
MKNTPPLKGLRRFSWPPIRPVSPPRRENQAVSKRISMLEVALQVRLLH